MPITDLVGEGFGVDYGAGDIPSFDTGWTAPDDWLDWLNEGDYNLPSFDMPGDVNPADWAGGTQTTMWDAVYQGAGISPDATGDEIASWLASQSFTDTLGGGASNEAINWFVDTYGQTFDFLSFDSLFGAQLSGMEEQYAMQEANMWESYEQWQLGQMSLLDDQFSTMANTYEENLMDITQNRRDQLSSLVDSRRRAERGMSEQLKSQRRAAGRTGFGANFRQNRNMDAAELQLEGLTGGAYQVTTGAEQAMDQLYQDYTTQSQGLMSEYTTAQADQFLTMEQQLEQWQLEFETSASTMYTTWASGIYSQMSDMLLGEGADWFSTLGGTGSGTDVFDPFGNYETDEESVVPGDCPPGTFACNDGTCVPPGQECPDTFQNSPDQCTALGLCSQTADMGFGLELTLCLPCGQWETTDEMEAYGNPCAGFADDEYGQHFCPQPDGSCAPCEDVETWETGDMGHALHTCAGCPPGHSATYPQDPNSTNADGSSVECVCVPTGGSGGRGGRSSSHVKTDDWKQGQSMYNVHGPPTEDEDSSWSGDY